MFKFVKRFCWLALLLAGAQSGLGFSLLGPINEPYQVPTIGHGLPGDIGAVKNLGEEYRRNNPVQYYAFDQNFLDYFGSNGVAEVEVAVSIMNGLTNFTSYSPELSEFPLEAVRINYRAETLRLRDLKTTALSLMTEEFGLAQPERFVWTLRDRRTQPNLSCPFMTYDVIKRNFDPVTFEPSSYVNGNLYSYVIIEKCTGADPLADAVEFSVDPLADQFSTVASQRAARNFGSFFTGLTRDDVGGFRYLYRTNNMNVEVVSPDSLLVFTNNTASQLLVSSNLTLLVAQSLTNDPAALLALYPGLIISSSSNFFVNVRVTNVFGYFTNFPFSPVGTAASLVLVTNFSTNYNQQFFAYQFANVITNQYATNGFTTVLDTKVTPVPLAPVGTVQTNVTAKTVFVPGLITGDFYLLPTNACGISIISTQTIVISTTNVTVVATNATGTTNVNNQAFSRSIVTYFTNHSYVIHVVTCDPAGVALRQGMNTFKYVRTSFDSLLGRFFLPITNRYTLNSVTNSQIVVETFERRVIQPDVLFSAEERQAPDQAWLGVGFRTDIDASGGFDTTGITPPPSGLLYGPGTIQSPIIIEFNKVGPLLINNYDPNFVNLSLSEEGASTNFVWGSYDASTNAPVVYPSGTSITDLENQVLFGVSTTSLASGTVGVPYSQQLQAYGGQPPYSWSLTPGSPGLPPGVTLSASGVISGTPTMVGIFDFSIRVRESGARTSDRALKIVINP